MHLAISKLLRGRRLWIALLLILMAVIGEVYWTRPARLPLLQGAHRIADVSAWERWWWLTDQRVFVLDESAPGTVTAFMLDTNSGKKTALSGLNRTLSTLGADCHYELSPNGKWMVALPWKAAPRTHWLISVSDGKIIACYPSRYFRGWLPDNRGWIGGNAAKGWRTDSVLWVNGDRASSRPAPPSINGEDLGLSATGNAWFGEYDPYSDTNLKLYEIDHNTGSVVLTRSIALPPSCLLSEIGLSPDRERLVWQVRPTSLYIPIIFGPQDVNSLWVSDAKGAGMKHLGDLSVTYGQDYDCDLSVEWLPDSRHLGITYRHALYVLSVD